MISPPWSIHTGCGTTSCTFIRAMGGVAMGLAHAELGGTADYAALIADAAHRFGDLHILVNNAGIIRRVAAQHMLSHGHGGKIVNVASMLSFQGGIRVASYTASRATWRGPWCSWPPPRRTMCTGRSCGWTAAG